MRSDDTAVILSTLRGRVRKSALPAILGLLGTVVSGQGFHYVHPGPPPGPRDFRQPPEIVGAVWRGPSIAQIQTSCWYAEPERPDQPVGGTHGTQNIIGFIPLRLRLNDEHADLSFHQHDFTTFSGGGAKGEFAPEDMPAGIFVSFRGHPVWRVSSVQQQSARRPLSYTGLVLEIAAEFVSEPSMGECYLYAAAWVLSTSKDQKESTPR